MKTITVQVDDATYDMFRSLRAMLTRKAGTELPGNGGVMTDAVVVAALVIGAYTAWKAQEPEGVL